MKTTIHSKGSYLSELHIEIPPKKFEQEWKTVSKEYQREVIIPGFRQGKASQAAIEKKYAREIHEEVMDRLVEYAIERLINEESFRFLDSPTVEKRELREDHSVFFIMSVMMRPNIPMQPKDYLSIELKVPAKRKATEEMVDRFVEVTREALSELIPIEGREARKGDVALISYEWIEEEVPNLHALQKIIDKDLVRNNDYFYPLNEEEDFLPGLLEVLLKMSLDEEQKAYITFPDDFEIQELQNQKIPYRVTLHELYSKELPNNEELLAKLKVEGSFVVLKENLKKKLQHICNDVYNDDLEEELMNELISKFSFEVPDCVIERFAKVLMENNHDDDERTNLSSYYEQAEMMARSMFIFETIAEHESLVPELEDFFDCFKKAAEEREMPLEDFLKQMDPEKEKYLAEFHDDALENRTIRFLLSKAKIVEVEP